ncbi:MAG TPA: ferritin-like domain-containing protein, partial [Phenylobacterium sp.]|nr:ferritin-like domain-containing protein [Phenylobacterium sp.]
MPGIKDLYAIEPEGSVWTVPQDFDVRFNWDYDDGRQTMMHLYRQGVEMQWNAETRIDWSQELDEDNPEQLPEQMLPISGMARYEAMSTKEKARVRRHFQAWQISQFMQGEQGALICAAKIVTQVPDVDSKFYASTQVIDEARHVESYKRLLAKFGVAYPMTPPLQELIDQVLRDSRWDMTYLGMQVVIEGLALAAFQQIRDHAQNP